MNNKRWLLPDGIDELLPPVAGFFEQVHRDILDLYNSWGYQLLIPPFVEYLDSLLVGAGSDLDSDTFKLLDPASGKLVGLRADMTPQAARIDSHQLHYDGPVRLCYLGTVLKAGQDAFGSSRTPIQIGAELFGHSGVESDVEVISLAYETLKACGINHASFDLGHVGIYRGLIDEFLLDDAHKETLFDALQRKAIPEIEALLNSLDISTEVKAMLLLLPELNGDADVLAQARDALKAAPQSVHDALNYVEQLLTILAVRLPGISIHIDLAELRGYHYHTGMVFAGFIPELGTELVRGGRYDGIGSEFGRSRPATGFSADLKTLVSAGKLLEKMDLQTQVIVAPWETSESLIAKVAELRGQGHIVIWDMPGADLQQYTQIQTLKNIDDNWTLETADN